MAITTTSASLLRLLQLSSVSLPVGGFSFSQGLEYAIECGWVKNVADTQRWLTVQLHESLARIDLPVLQGAMVALQENDAHRWQNWNDIALANRETKDRGEQQQVQDKNDASKDQMVIHDDWHLVKE